jgi:F-type H+-transporting ATPase subunit delta
MTQTETKRETVLDSGEGKLARVYAEALFNVAEKSGKGDLLLEQIESLVHDLFRRQPLLEAFFDSNAIKRDSKAKVLRATLEPALDSTFFDFLMVLNEHDRLGLIRSIWVAYRQLRDKRARRVRVRVRSVSPLSNDQLARLQQEMRDVFQLEPVIETNIDEGLLGGMVVQVGDWLFDGSVRTRLEQLRKQLMVRRNYEIQGRRDRFCID